MNTLALDRTNELLIAYGAARGMRNVALNEAGVLAFNYKGRLDIVLELSSAGDTLYFYSPLCPLPGQDRESFLEELLTRNLLFGGTNGSTLAVDSQENRVMLCYAASLDQLDDVLLSNVIENFLETALKLQEELQALAVSKGLTINISESNNPDLPFGMGIRI